jgi:hypothetical protein
MVLYLTLVCLGYRARKSMEWSGCTMASSMFFCRIVFLLVALFFLAIPFLSMTSTSNPINRYPNTVISLFPSYFRSVSEIRPSHLKGPGLSEMTGIGFDLNLGYGYIKTYLRRYIWFADVVSSQDGCSCFRKWNHRRCGQN